VAANGGAIKVSFCRNGSLGGFGISKPMYDPPPLDFGPLKIDQKANRPAGGAQIIEALCHVLVAEPLDTFELDH
jgi:hypothetical protein